MVWGCEIHFTAEVGKGTLLGHYGLGVVVGQAAKIGERVLIKQNVTIGISGRLAEIGTPRIGDDVYIGTGAKILGPITIGSGSVIGANSVVTMDIPPNSLVVGIPGRISKSNINRAEYWPPMM
jgi:serine O-acetyltransferase